MVELTIKVTNPEGLHARPAALFVQIAGKFTSSVWISKNDRQVNAKSIMGIMSLAISPGTDLIIGAEGEDEHLAVKELTDFVTSDFKE